MLQVLEFQCLMEGKQVRVAGYPPEGHVVLWGETLTVSASENRK